MTNPFAPLLQGSLWKQTLSLLLGLPLGVAYFTWVVALVTTAFGLLITLLGIPLLAVTVRSGRLIGAIERARLRHLAGADVPPPANLPASADVWPWLRASLGDGAGWKGLAYGVVMLPWGVLAFGITVTWWSFALGLVTAPLWEWRIDDSVGTWFTGLPRSVERAAGVVLGVLLLVLGAKGDRGTDRRATHACTLASRRGSKRDARAPRR